MARKLKVDFNGIESFVKCGEGEHIVILRELTEKSTQNGDDMLVGKFEVIKGSCTGAKVFENFVLIPTALWKFKSFLDAAGVKSEGKVQIDLDTLIGKRCIVNVAHEEYKGQLKAKITEYKKLGTITPDEEDEVEDEEEEEEVKPKKEIKKKQEPKKKKAASPPEDDDEDEDWDEV